MERSGADCLLRRLQRPRAAEEPRRSRRTFQARLMEQRLVSGESRIQVVRRPTAPSAMTSPQGRLLVRGAPVQQ